MFEKYATTHRHRFAGHKLNTLEVLLVLALVDHAKLPADQQNLADLQKLWRRYLASNLEHNEWRKKGWSQYGPLGWPGWFKRALKGLLMHGLLAAPCQLTDQTRACAVAFREAMQPPLGAYEFGVYCNTTYAQVKKKRLQRAGYFGMG